MNIYIYIYIIILYYIILYYILYIYYHLLLYIYICECHMSISKNDHWESSPSCHSYGFCDQGIMVLFYRPPNQHNYCIEINNAEVETFTDFSYLSLPEANQPAMDLPMRLFNRDNFVMTGRASAIAFLTYFTMNVAFTGVPVPTGNFTGTMVIGGMAGRVMGCDLDLLWFKDLYFPLAKIAQRNSSSWWAEISRSSGCLSECFPSMDFASNGIYAMIGAAAMLSSFKQMSVACVLFISSWVATWAHSVQ